MSEIITYPLPSGPNYVIPDVGDENWGQNVTDFLVNIPLGTPPTSGTFALTGDLSFGASFGLISQYYKTSLINPASSGLVRLAKTDTIDWRNNANTGNLILGINGSDQLTYNGTPIVISATGNLIDTGTDGITVTGGTGAVLGSGTSLSQHVADASHNGYLSSTDWSAFNSKGSGSVTSVALTVPAFLSVSGSPITTSGTLAVSLSGSALPVANGGTGDTSFTAYEVLCGGTASTTPLQQVSGVGLSGQVLTSNGIGTLPTWQNASGTGTVDSGTANHLTYYPASTNEVASSVFLINNGTGDISIPGQATVGANGVKYTSASNASIVKSASIATTDRTWTLPDISADATFAALEGSQTFSGTKTFSSTLTMSGATIVMGSNKITSLAAGSASGDAVAYQQLHYTQSPIQTTDSTEVNITTATWTAAGASATITPTSTSHRTKVTISINLRESHNGANVQGDLRLKRGSTVIANFFEVIRGGSASAGNDASQCNVSVSWIDLPGQSGAQLYSTEVQNASAAGTVSVNRDGSPLSVMILEEVI